MSKLLIDFNKLFSNYFNTLKYPAFILDSEDKIIHANKTAVDKFNTKLGESFNNYFTLDGDKKTIKVIGKESSDYIVKNYSLNDKYSLIILEQFEQNLDLSEIIDKIPVGLIIFNKEGFPVYHNREFENLWGISSELLNGYNLFEDDRLKSTGVLNKIKEIFEGKSYLFLEGYYDKLLEKGKGYKIWVETTIFPIYNEDEKVEYVVIIHKDISEVKLAEEEIKIAKDSEMEANRLKNAFLQNISHEIRTPMNSIIGFGELIVDTVKNKIASEESYMLTNFMVGIKRLNRTLNQILELTQIDTGNYEVNIQPLNLKEEIEEAVNSFRHELAEKKLELYINLDEKHLNILADKAALNRILNNLIENAIKFTNKGYIKIESYSNINETILFCSIKDTGIGISEEYLNHIFEPFSQEEDGFNRPYEGNGLGLALTKRYLDIINSSITVDSVKGVGSTFTFTLPIFKS